MEEHQGKAWHCFFVNDKAFMKYSFIHSFYKIITEAHLHDYKNVRKAERLWEMLGLITVYFPNIRCAYALCRKLLTKFNYACEFQSKICPLFWLGSVREVC